MLTVPRSRIAQAPNHHPIAAQSPPNRRLINRFVELRIVVQAMWSSLVNVSNILIVAALFFIMFGILGVGLFMGRFHYCDIKKVNGQLVVDESVFNSTIYTPESGFHPMISKAQCLEAGAPFGNATEWVNSPDNFDNIGNAVVVLFQMSTGQARARGGIFCQICL